MEPNYNYLTGKGEPTKIDLANEIVAGFVPGLSTAQALRDYKKAAEDKDYLGMGLSALGSVPVLGGLAKTATLLPAILRMNKASEIAEAEEMLRKGASHEAIWKRTGLFKYPGELSEAVPGVQARWGFELPTKKIEDRAISPNQVTNIGAVVDNPELYKVLPNLGSILLTPGLPTGLDPRHVAGAYSHWEGPNGVMYLNPMLFNPQNAADLRKTVAHELNHAVNSHTGQLGSLGYGVRDRLTTPQLDAAKKASEMLRQVAPEHSLLADHILNSALTNYTGRGWTYSAGERLAEADAFRSTNKVSQTPRAHFNVGAEPRINQNMLNPDDVSLHLVNALRLYSEPEPVLARLLHDLK